MGIFQRKSKWEKLSSQVVKRSGRLASAAGRNSSVRAGAVAASGAVALTVASAAVSAMRRRASS